MRYALELSNHTRLEINQADYEKFVQYSGTGNFLQLSCGTINPSFVISIIPLGKDLPKHPLLKEPEVYHAGNIKDFKPSFLKEHDESGIEQ